MKLKNKMTDLECQELHKLQFNSSAKALLSSISPAIGYVNLRTIQKIPKYFDCGVYYQYLHVHVLTTKLYLHIMNS